MRIGGSVLLIGLLVLACEPAGEPDRLPQADTPAPVTPDPPPVTSPEEIHGPAAAPIEPVEGSGVAGQMAVSRTDGRAVITVAVQGAPPESRLQAVVLSGTCDDPGGGVADLDLFFAERDGSARREMEAVLPPPGPDGQILALYQPETGGDRMLACGELPL